MTVERVPRVRLVASSPRVAPFELAVEMFIAAKVAERCTDWTVRNYRRMLRYFTDRLLAHGVDATASITPHHIRAYLAELTARGLKASSVHDMARPIKTWLRFFYAEEVIQTNPMARVGMPRQDREMLPAFTPEDVRRLFGACRTARDTAIVFCLLDIGCRAGELVALNISSVDAKSGAIMVRQGKGRKDRLTFLGAKARRALTKYLMSRPDANQDAPLWVTEREGDRLRVRGLQMLLRRPGQRAGVDYCHPHTFRRTFALWSLRAGMNI